MLGSRKAGLTPKTPRRGLFSQESTETTELAAREPALLPLLTPVRKAGSFPRFEQLSGFLPGKAGALPVQGRPATGIGQGLDRRCTGLGAGEVREQPGGRQAQGRPLYIRG